MSTVHIVICPLCLRHVRTAQGYLFSHPKSGKRCPASYQHVSKAAELAGASDG